MILRTFDIPNAMYGFVTQVKCSHEHKRTLMTWAGENRIPCTVVSDCANHMFYFKHEHNRLLFLLSNAHE